MKNFFFFMLGFVHELILAVQNKCATGHLLPWSIFYISCAFNMVFFFSCSFFLFRVLQQRQSGFKVWTSSEAVSFLSCENFCSLFQYSDIPVTYYRTSFDHKMTAARKSFLSQILYKMCQKNSMISAIICSL